MPTTDTWTADQLDRIGNATELDLASRRADGTLTGFTTMWVVRLDDDLYVRSAGGPDRPWYRHALANGVGRIRAGGVETDTTFVDAVDDAPHDDIDAGYHRKYDRYGPGPVGHVTGPASHAVTVRLVPLDPPDQQEH
jgi:hypothetical protein